MSVLDELQRRRALVLVFVVASAAVPATAESWDPPETRRESRIDEYYGQRVRAPYRWLEGDGDDVAAWVALQNAATDAYLTATPASTRVAAVYTEMETAAIEPVPVVRGDTSFYLFPTGIYRQAGGGLRDRVLDRALPDGRIVLQIVPSPDGSRIATRVSAEGGHEMELVILDGVTGEITADVGRIGPTPVGWTGDGGGVLYTSALTPRGVETRIHVIGTSPSRDRSIFAPGGLLNRQFAGASMTGRYLFFVTWRGSFGGAELSVIDLAAPQDDNYLEIGGRDEGIVQYLETLGDAIICRTTRDAPRGRVVLIDLDPARRDGIRPHRNWKELIPEDDLPLHHAAVVGPRILCAYLDGDRHRLRAYDLDGRRLFAPQPPRPGFITGLTGSRGDAFAYYVVDDLIHPPAVCRIDAGTLVSEVVRDTEPPFSEGTVEVRREVVTATDGTELPVFLAGRDLDHDRPRATWLHVHGGHGVVHLPHFDAGVATWIELGGVYAHALIRGGGEYGEAWHEAGRRERKMTTFEDALAVADWLVASGLTEPARLGISGHGHGGLVVGVAITRRPELFGAAATRSGIFDMLRFHLMGGYRKYANPEYGSAGLDTDFPAISAYTPLQYVREGTAYPPMYLAVGEGDARVDAHITQRDAAPPAHSYKFAAMLQHASSSEHPVLLRTLAGSGPRAMTGEAIRRHDVERLTFLGRELGLEGVDQP